MDLQNSKPLYTLLVPLGILLVQFAIGIGMILVGRKSRQWRSSRVHDSLSTIPYVGWLIDRYFSVIGIVPIALGMLLVFIDVLLVIEIFLRFFAPP